MSKPSFYNDLSIPIIAAPLFLISGPKLVIECCKNGIVGTFPALNHRTTEGFEQWVIQIKEELSNFEKETGKKAAPFGESYCSQYKSKNSCRFKNLCKA